MPTSPRITVVTSSYNQGEFIGRTIDSVRCSMCNRVRHNDLWREPEEALAAKLLRREHINFVIYKICPGCRTNALGPRA